MAVTRGRRTRPSAATAAHQIFLSYSGEDAFEASLLQYAIEQMLADQNATVWTYQRDQARDERNIQEQVMNVFISYAIGDKTRIRKLIRELKSRGIVAEEDKIIYTSDALAPGSSLRANIRETIEAASKVVVFWSGAGAESDWVNYEAGMAEALGKPLYVVVSKRARSTFPKELEHAQIVELENLH